MSKRQRQSASQRLFWLLSIIMVASMVVSTVVFILPGPAESTPTPWPTFPVVAPTAEPSPSPTVAAPRPTATPAATPAPAGPELPTAGPTAVVSPTVGPPTPTAPAVAKAGIGDANPAPTDAAAGVPPVDPGAVVSGTEPLPDSVFTFAVAGDSRGNPTVYRKVLDAATAGGAAFLIHTGDLVNVGTDAEWQAFLQPMTGFSLPFYPVPGNHDGLDGKLDGYLRYSGAPAAHYSFDRGQVHFALADSHNGGVTAAELDWLRQDLSATDRPVKIVALHHPPFDPDGTDHVMAFGNEAFMALMVEQGVDYVFAGHIHAYVQGERDGVVYTITGGGGAPLYRQGHPQAFYHYLRVTVDGDRVTIEVIKV